MKKLVATLFIALLLFGCITSETREWKPENVDASPVPSISVPTTTIQPSPSPTPTPSPTPSPSPAPTANATITPSPNPTATITPDQAECTLTVQNLGEDNEKRIIVQLNVADGNAYIQCNSTSGWQQITLDQSNLGYLDCSYTQNASEKYYAAKAKSNNAECSATVTIAAETLSYGYTINGSGSLSDSFTVDKNDNSTTRQYLLNNTGEGELTGFACSSEDDWAEHTSCPSNLLPNATTYVTYSFDVTGLEAGVYSTALTLECDEDSDHTIAVTMTVTETTPAPAPIPTCEMTSASPSSINRTDNVTNSIITLNFYNFSGTITPVFDSSLGGTSTGDESCGAAPDGTCTVTWNFTGATAGTNSITAILNSTYSCTGSVDVEVKD